MDDENNPTLSIKRDANSVTNPNSFLTDDLGEMFLPQLVVDLAARAKNITINLPSPPWELHDAKSGLHHEIFKHWIKTVDLSFSSGKFTKLEEEKLQEIWGEFAGEYGFDESELEITEYLDVTQKMLFTQYLGRALPQRPLYAILKKFRQLKPPNYGEDFTGFDDDLIRQLTTSYNKKGSNIYTGKVLGRSSNSIFRRNKSFRESPPIVYDWTLCEILLKKLKHDKCLYLEFDDDEIWKKLSRMGLGTVYTLKFVWHSQLSTQMFAQSKIFLREIIIRVIFLITAFNWTKWSDIRWKVIAKRFAGVSPHFLSVNLRRHMIHNIPAIHNFQFDECLEYLYMKYHEELSAGTHKCSMDRNLKTYKFGENGELQLDDRPAGNFYQSIVDDLLFAKNFEQRF